MFRTTVCVSLLAAAAAAPDQCTYKDPVSCLAAGARTDYACSWCKSATIPSDCVTNEVAHKLPPSVFECGNATRSDCDTAKSNATCQTLAGCSWCTSRTVGPLCANYMNATSLPKSVFTCVGPYFSAEGPAAEEEEAEEAPAEPAPPLPAEPAEAAAAPGSYDFFELVQQWAITDCQDQFRCKASWQFFTLHGLWPQRNDGSWPSNCGGAAFDPSVLAPIQQAMDTFWVSLNGPSSTFWAHEWTTHGTCAADVFSSQFDFFNSTLSYLSSYNITRALAAAGISPDNSRAIPLSAFDKALEAALGATAVLQCDSQDRVEVATMCISKQGDLIKCPSNVVGKGCGGQAILPAHM
jgi:ribonuclease T2